MFRGAAKMWGWIFIHTGKMHGAGAETLRHITPWIPPQGGVMENRLTLESPRGLSGSERNLPSLSEVPASQRNSSVGSAGRRSSDISTGCSGCHAYLQCPGTLSRDRLGVVRRKRAPCEHTAEP